MKKVLKFAILFFVIIIIILVIQKIIEYNTSPKISVDDFATVKELIEFDGHEYIDMKNSSDEDCKKDIYIKFSKPPINEDGTTNKNLYETVISHLAKKIKGENFRLIDTEKNIVIKIKFEEDQINTYTINGDSKYWEHIQSNYQIDNYKETTISDFTVTSQVLNDIIINKWVYSKINLGAKDSIEDNYEIYFDEGYKIRKIGSEIYNIIFTQNYNEEILNQISVKTSMENVKKILGTPTFEDTNNDIIGYKSESFYIFFTNSEVSIYPSDKYNEEKSKKFGELVTELNKTGDMNTFINKLTDLYPDYEYYSDNNNYVDIRYPLLGFSVRMGYPNKNGIILYSNFQGWITENITIDEMKTDKTIPSNVYTVLNKNLVLEAEGNRVANESYLDSGL